MGERPQEQAKEAQAAFNLGLKLNEACKTEEANASYRTAVEHGAASGTPEGREMAAVTCYHAPARGVAGRGHER